MEKQKIAVLVGSLRKASFSRKIALEIINAFPENLQAEIIEIGELPHYNEDLDTENPPQAWIDFRKKIGAAVGVLFVTPEYNRSVPGVLKNAIDVGSRPHGKSGWAKKPGAVVGVTPGAIGAFGANHALRQSMVFLDVPMLQQPEVYLGEVAKLFDDQGHLDQGTQAFLKKFADAYASWVARFAA